MIVTAIAVGVLVVALAHAWRESRWLRRVERASGDPEALQRLLRRR